MHMHWCLRCNKPYAAPSTFCKSCQSLSPNQLRHKAFQTSSLISERCYILPGEFEEKEGWRAPSLPSCTTLSLLQEFIPAVQHENWSLPTLPDMPQSSDALENLALEDTRDCSGGSGNSQSSCNTLDEVDNNLDQLDDSQPYLDPLTVRLATKKKGKRQDNVGTGLAPGRSDAQPVRHRRVVSAQLQIILAALAIMAVIALLMDGMLVSASLARHRNTNKLNTIPPSSPVLTVMPSTVYPGQVVLLRMSNFSTSTHVFLSHDIQEPMRTDVGSSLIQVGPNGDADLHILVEDTWRPGPHIIEGEDVTTHYTASTTIQVIGAGPVQSPHLLVNQSSLNMGADLQGANTIQSLLLHNAGGGAIAWEAGSDQPWLMLTPTQGVFSASQSLAVAVTRANLKPGSYEGTITLVSNTGSSIPVSVQMIVNPLPSNAGPVLVSTPPALSFMATDGQSNPTDQLLTISNPGSQPLFWTTGSITAMASGDQNIPFLSDASWLSTNPTSGEVAPGSTAQVHVIVHSQNVLPGVYNVMLTFVSTLAGLNSPQPVVASLTVQPRCGVTTNVGVLAFSAIAGRGNPASQGLVLGATAGCAEVIDWQVFTSVSWLTVTPTRGRLLQASMPTAGVNVNVGNLLPGTYNAFIVFLTGQRTQTVIVQLMVLSSSSPFSSPTSGGQLTASPGPGTPAPGPGTPTPTPVPGAPPVIGISPFDLNFNATQGQGNPAGQIETITNSGGSVLNWQASKDSATSTWLNLAPMNGTIDVGQKGQITVGVNTTGLEPGTYSTQVTVKATDSSGTQAQGSPQILTVTLTVYQPCSLQVAPGNLLFTATLLQPNPAGQNIAVKETGNCAYPVSWTASVDANSRSWLSVSSISGTGNSTIVVYASSRGMLIGQHSGQITLSATDNRGVVLQNSPQAVLVILTVIG